MDRFPASNAIAAALGTRPMAMCDDGKRTRFDRDFHSGFIINPSRGMNGISTINNGNMGNHSVMCGTYQLQCGTPQL